MKSSIINNTFTFFALFASLVEATYVYKPTCKYTVCNQAGRSYNIEHTNSGMDLNMLGSIGNGQCRTIYFPWTNTFVVRDGGLMAEYYYPRSCGYKFIICGFPVTNKSNRTIKVRAAGTPRGSAPSTQASTSLVTTMTIKPNETKTVVGGNGVVRKVTIYDSSGQYVLETRYPSKCGAGIRYTGPTPAPTPNPTPYPTPNPTPYPTPYPTPNPTPYPTSSPTSSPTEEPTAQPTNKPTFAPTLAPTYAPTDEPTDEPTDAPTDEPTDGPTASPTTSPTASPTKAPAPEPTKAPVPSSRPEGCGSLKKCVLVNLDDTSAPEVGLNSSSPIQYVPNAGYSIRCDTEGTINKFVFEYENGEKSDHTEWGMPWWMRGDSPNWINRVPYLSRGTSCGRKSVTAVGHIWRGECFRESFELEAKC